MSIDYNEKKYLSTIYKIFIRESKVTTISISDSLSIKTPNVSRMLKTLDSKGLILYKKHYGVQLTSKGKSIALNLIRKHRLWETFLVDKLNFNWDEVHKIAEQLERVESPELIDRIDEFIGNPKIDPHGDPIPSKNGKINHPKWITLDRVSDIDKATLVRIKNQSEDLLKFLSKNSIKIGTEIQILEKYEFDNSIRIEIDNKEINLSSLVSSNLIIDI